jgi:hypothetical protein
MENQDCTVRELTDDELDSVGGGIAHMAQWGDRIGTGSCFQWIPSRNSWYACSLIDPATKLPY